MIQTCTRCGRVFDAKEPFYHLCWDCWKIQNRQHCVYCGDAVSWQAAKAGYRVCVLCANEFPMVAEQLQRQLQDPLPLDPEILRAAIRLCHPDLHPENRRELANRVTARLNQLLQSERV